MLCSFLEGVFKGAKKGAEKHGERIGEQLVDELVRRAEKLRSKVESITPSKTEQLQPGQLERLLRGPSQELNNLLEEPAVRELVLRDDPVLTSEATVEIQQHLRNLGYPEDILVERSQSMVVRIHRVLKR